MGSGKVLWWVSYRVGVPWRSWGARRTRRAGYTDTWSQHIKTTIAVNVSFYVKSLDYNFSWLSWGKLFLTPDSYACPGSPAGPGGPLGPGRPNPGAPGWPGEPRGPGGPTMDSPFGPYRNININSPLPLQSHISFYSLVQRYSTALAELGIWCH